MPKTFKKLSPFKLAKLTPEEKMNYYYKLKDYMIENELYGKNLAFKKLLHPLQILIIKILRIACGDKLIVYGKHKISAPTIIVFTHICRQDLERISEALNVHFTVLSGDPEHVFGVFPDNLFMWLNNAILFNNEDFSDSAITLKILQEQIEKRNINVLWAPEGTWNISRKTLVLPLYDGPAIVSLKTGADILPVAIDRDGKTYRVKIGETISPKTYLSDVNLKKRKQRTKKFTDDIRESLATLKYELIEMKGVYNRSELTKQDIENEISTILEEFTDGDGNIIYTKEKIRRRINKN